MEEDLVDDKTQAEMAIKLSNSVRELIREELDAALNDSQWLWGVHMYTLRDVLLQNLDNNSQFRAAVTSILRQQFNKP